MARGMLGEYGPDTMKPQKPGASKGGIHPGMERDVMGYKEPTIPGWSPYGSMKPGIGGSVSVCGTQGPKPSMGDGAGGSVGIKNSGGEGRGMGTNRKG